MFGVVFSMAAPRGSSFPTHGTTNAVYHRVKFQTGFLLASLTKIYVCNVYGESLLVAGDGNGGELVVVVPKVS